MPSSGSKGDLRLIQPHGERRRGARVEPVRIGLAPDGLLLPGLEIRIMNISRGGALIASPAALRPDADVDLQVRVAQGAHVLRGCVAGCWVDSVQPLRFMSRVVFDGARGRMPEGECASPAHAGDIVVHLRDLP